MTFVFVYEITGVIIIFFSSKQLVYSQEWNKKKETAWKKLNKYKSIERICFVKKEDCIMIITNMAILKSVEGWLE